LVCRICQENTIEILDLGMSPPANSLSDNKDINFEKYPLKLEYCNNCKNIQLKDCLDIDKLYKHYYYQTPNSSMLQKHYEDLTEFLKSKNYINLSSNIVEIGSNIGSYLKFLKPHVNKILGIDPAENIVEKANNMGIPTICNFFNPKTASDLANNIDKTNAIIARHCFAHNESPHELLKSVKILLDADGFAIIENAYVLNTLENNEFDQIYHEHMFYFSIQSMQKALSMNDLSLVDIFLSQIHGGSITFIAQHKNKIFETSNTLNKYLDYEKSVLSSKIIKNFRSKSLKIRDELKKLILSLKKKNPKIVIYTYGATAKGNTLLNFAELNYSHIDYCIDSTKIKQGKFLPGSKIKIMSEEYAEKNPPDFFLLTAWNYKDEIINKVRNKGNLKSCFIVPFPQITIIKI
tara:strand:- start:4111 stop:5328 length:1218 start_codon:yes stop_codon:yes gene_type:complete